MRLRPLWTVYRGFEYVYPQVMWALFILGVSGVVLTLASVYPPHWNNPFGMLVSCVLWIVLAQQSFVELREKKPR